MSNITLQQLLEAGCHFGHKAERWHPKASQFIYTEKDGVHIIDLVKTKAGLDVATAFIKDLVGSGKEILFIGTKRQAKDIVQKAAVESGAPYMTERWIGGFLTNWESIHRNIQKIIRLDEEQKTGVWKKKRYPKHEQVKLSRYLERLKVFYGGVLVLNSPPQALFVIDVKKEDAAIREAVRTGIPVIAVIDTNADPTDVTYPIPANDDAVGSISILTGAIADAYKAGKDIHAKQMADVQKKAEKQKTEAGSQKTEGGSQKTEAGSQKTEVGGQKSEEKKDTEKETVKDVEKLPAEPVQETPKKKRGRPAKVVS